MSESALSVGENNSCVPMLTENLDCFLYPNCLLETTAREHFRFYKNLLSLEPSNLLHSARRVYYSNKFIIPNNKKSLGFELSVCLATCGFEKFEMDIRNRICASYLTWLQICFEYSSNTGFYLEFEFLLSKTPYSDVLLVLDALFAMHMTINLLSRDETLSLDILSLPVLKCCKGVATHEMLKLVLEQYSHVEVYELSYMFYPNIIRQEWTLPAAMTEIESLGTSIMTVIHLQLIGVSTGKSHANALIYDRAKNLWIRFEPHGNSDDTYTVQIDKILKKEFSNYVAPYDYCRTLGLQYIFFVNCCAHVTTWLCEQYVTRQIEHDRYLEYMTNLDMSEFALAIKMYDDVYDKLSVEWSNRKDALQSDN